MPHWALSQSNTSIAWAQPGPFICSGSVSARPIRARRGPLKRALYIRTNHRGPSILVTENVPILSISPPNVPTLVMFVYILLIIITLYVKNTDLGSFWLFTTVFCGRVSCFFLYIMFFFWFYVQPLSAYQCARPETCVGVTQLDATCLCLSQPSPKPPPVSAPGGGSE